MLRPIDSYFLNQEEPNRSCLQALRLYILGWNEHVTEDLSYGMPFYYYKGKRFCYLWVHKKSGQPYIGIVDGKKIDDPDLILEKRARMKIFLLDNSKDLPVKRIDSILKKIVRLYD